jgi:uncharacterized membrane protein YkgB
MRRNIADGKELRILDEQLALSLVLAWRCEIKFIGIEIDKIGTVDSA